MKFGTFSILIGNEACNAKCPFCVSKMTPNKGLVSGNEINIRNLKKASTLAKETNVNTVLLTGKGEPTLFPDQITKHLEAIDEFKFPFIELQTNGIQIADNKESFGQYLDKWYELGLTTVALSVANYEPEANRQIYLPDRDNYIDLPELIEYLHEKNLSVRLAGMMFEGGIDNASKLEKMVEFAKKNNVEQLTLRSISKPSAGRDKEVYNWVEQNELSQDTLDEMKNHVEEKGTKLLDLPHGGIVYDFEGKNLCLGNCLTRSTNPNDIRQLIYFPDGHLRYDWEKQGAILM
jgi:molybdenum cofactor biosynthesis enzyme MoaA